jgi:allantoate deiminase
MTMRRDALAGAAEMVLTAERIGRAGEQMVATVGRIEAFPGATNIIAGKVVFTVDLRCMDDATRKAAVAKVESEARRIAEARKLDVAFEHFHATNAVACDAKLQDTLAAAISDVGGNTLHLPSGAGHDAQMMARLCPSAMMFVRCRDGISHNPAEFCAPADMGLAVAALIRFIERHASRNDQS